MKVWLEGCTKKLGHGYKSALDLAVSFFIDFSFILVIPVCPDFQETGETPPLSHPSVTSARFSYEKRILKMKSCFSFASISHWFAQKIAKRLIISLMICQTLCARDRKQTPHVRSAPSLSHAQYLQDILYSSKLF